MNVKPLLKLIAAAAFVAGGASSALASPVVTSTTYDLFGFSTSGAADPATAPLALFIGSSSGPFDTFSATGASLVSAWVAPFLTPGSVSKILFDNTAGTLHFEISGSSGSFVLPTGEYFVSALVTGAPAAGGMYEGSLTVAAVPEPEAWLATLAGVVVVGGMAGLRRRQSQL